MFNVRLAGDHLYGKLLFTYLTLVMSFIQFYFVLSFFPRDVLDEIWAELSQFLRIFLPILLEKSKLVFRQKNNPFCFMNI